MAGSLRRLGLAQIPAGEPRPEPAAPGAGLRRYLLQPPARSRIRRSRRRWARWRMPSARARPSMPAFRTTAPEQTARAAQILRELGTPCLIHQPRYSMFNRGPENGLLDVLVRGGHRRHRVLPAGAGLAHQPLPDGHSARLARRPRPPLPQARATSPRKRSRRSAISTGWRKPAASRSRRWPSPGCCASRPSPRR